MKTKWKMGSMNIDVSAYIKHSYNNSNNKGSFHHSLFWSSLINRNKKTEDKACTFSDSDSLHMRLDLKNRSEDHTHTHTVEKPGGRFLWYIYTYLFRSHPLCPLFVSFSLVLWYDDAICLHVSSLHAISYSLSRPCHEKIFNATLKGKQ